MIIIGCDWKLGGWSSMQIEVDVLSACARVSVSGIPC